MDPKKISPITEPIKKTEKMSIKSPYQILSEWADRVQTDVFDNPEQKPNKIWQGFTFCLAGMNIAIPMIGNYEISCHRRFFPIPLAQPWVVGVTRIRENIYSVVDLAAFLGKSAIARKQSAHLIVLPDDRLKSALLVETRIGLKSFKVALPAVDTANIDPQLQPYMEKGVQEDATLWHVLDIKKIIGDPRFTSLAI